MKKWWVGICNCTKRNMHYQAFVHFDPQRCSRLTTLRAIPSSFLCVIACVFLSVCVCLYLSVAFLCLFFVCVCIVHLGWGRRAVLAITLFLLSVPLCFCLCVFAVCFFLCLCSCLKIFCASPIFFIVCVCTVYQSWGRKAVLVIALCLLYVFQNTGYLKCVLSEQDSLGRIKREPIGVSKNGNHSSTSNS